MPSLKKLPIKVLHLSYNDIANQMAMISAAQKKYLKVADSISYFANYIGDNCDFCLHLEEYKGIKKYLKWFFFLASHPSIFLKYDIYNFHFGRSILPKNLDLPLLKKLGKRIVFTFHGSDIRNRRLIDPRLSDQSWRTERNKKNALKYADLVIVTTPDLLSFIPEKNPIWIPAGVDEKFLSKQKKKIKIKKNKEEFLIVHAPTHRLTKGTEFIVSAINILQKKYKNLRFILLENMPRVKVLQHLAEADLAIDRMVIGTHGLFSVEAMALGVPVICYLKDEFMAYYGEIPIIRANKDNLHLVIEEFINNPSKLDYYRKRGPLVVKNHYSAEVIAKKYIKEYQKLLNERK